jgi:hypothetical protein
VKSSEVEEIAVDVQDNVVMFDERRIELGSPVLEAMIGSGVLIVLLDPDSYLKDPEYRRKRRAGAPAVRNLRAFSMTGDALWEAELPEDADYYHRLVGADPIEADSFSSFRCRIDPQNGRIVSKVFLK